MLCLSKLIPSLNIQEWLERDVNDHQLLIDDEIFATLIEWQSPS